MLHLYAKAESERPTGADFYIKPRRSKLITTKRGQMSLHTKNHNIKLKNLKTHFNRERGNHNIEFNKHNILFSSIIFSLVGITILSGFLLSRPKGQLTVSAAEGSTLASVVVPDVCSLASSSTNHTGTVNGGSYTENFGGESTVTVTCNDRNGYSVYAVGYSNNELGTTTLIGTSTGLVIPSGTSTSGDVSNWAMKLTPGTGAFAPTILNGYNNYSLVPATATKVATLTSDINVSNSSQFKTSYAVAVAPTQAADTYIGKVKYTVVHPNYTNADGTLETYNIPVTFAGTGVSSVTFEATGYPTRTVSTSGSTANLTAGVQYTVTASFTSGYEFVSWALNNASYGTLGSTTTNPTTFTPNANSASAEITITGQKPIVTIASGGNMQDVSSKADGGCPSTLTTGTAYELTDPRDGSVYKVARLADGNCWMLDNLALDIASLTKAQLYGSGTTAGKLTNASETTLGYLKSGGGSSPYTATAVANATSDIDKYDVPQINKASINTVPSNAPADSLGSNKVGIYYNYCAATAGSYCYSSSSSSGNASEDVCPYGWRMPTGGSSGEYKDLYTAYSSNATNFKKALSTPLSGYFYESSAYSQGSGGYFWSSNRNDNTYTYLLIVASSSVYPSNFNDRSAGYAVRCLLK